MKHFKNIHFFMFFLMVFFTFVSNILAKIIILKAPFLARKENIWIYQSMAAIIGLIVPIIIYKAIKRKPFREIIPFNKISLKNIILIIFISFTLQPMLQLIASITNLFYKDEISSVVYDFASLSLPKALFTIGLVPAITEELVFRGVILSGLKKYSLLAGILISSLYFGIMHLTFTQLFYAITAGIIFSLLVCITKSIYSSILMHFIFNSTQIVVAYYVIRTQPNIDEHLSNVNNVLGDLIFSSIKFLIFLPFLALSIYLFIKNNKKGIEELKLEKPEKFNREKVFGLFFFINIAYFLYFVYFK